jgi:hypothetical protein
MFAQHTEADTIPGGGSRDFSETWQPGDKVGHFVAVGTVTASNVRVDQRADFEIRKTQE